MNDNKIVTVVIPIYNVEKYLRKCVDSVIRQSYKQLEIILVDDGSTDASGKICDGYKNIDSRVIVIHKDNGGLSDARNVGIAAANGTYLVFVDSDDYIHHKTIEILLRTLLDNDADMSCCGYKDVFENNEYEDEIIDDYKIYAWDKVETLKKILLSQNITNSAWAKLYKKSLFENVRFPVGRIFEDQGTTYKIVDKIHKAVFVDAILWYYLIRGTSIQNSSWNEKCFDEIDLCRETVEFVNENYPQLKVEAVNRWLSSCFHILFKYYDLHITDEAKPEKIHMLESEIKRNRWMCIFSNRASRKVRLGCICTLFGLGFSYRIYTRVGARGSLGQ